MSSLVVPRDGFSNLFSIFIVQLSFLQSSWSSVVLMLYNLLPRNSPSSFPQKVSWNHFGHFSCNSSPFVMLWFERVTVMSSLVVPRDGFSNLFSIFIVQLSFLQSSWSSVVLMLYNLLPRNSPSSFAPKVFWNHTGHFFCNSSPFVMLWVEKVAMIASLVDPMDSLIFIVHPSLSQSSWSSVVDIYSNLLSRNVPRSFTPKVFWNHTTHFFCNSSPFVIPWMEKVAIISSWVEPRSVLTSFWSLVISKTRLCISSFTSFHFIEFPISLSLWGFSNHTSIDLI